MLHVVFEVAFVNISCFIYEFAVTVFATQEPLAFVNCSIVVNKSTISWELAFEKVSFIDVLVTENYLTKAMGFICAPLSAVEATIFEAIGTMTLFGVVFKITFKDVSIWLRFFALTISFTICKPSLIEYAFGSLK